MVFSIQDGPHPSKTLGKCTLLLSGSLAGSAAQRPLGGIFGLSWGILGTSGWHLGASQAHPRCLFLFVFLVNPWVQSSCMVKSSKRRLLHVTHSALYLLCTLLCHCSVELDFVSYSRYSQVHFFLISMISSFFCCTHSVFLYFEVTVL